MTQAEAKARALIAKRTTSALVADFEITNRMPISLELTMSRGWIMDELEKRSSAAFEAWIDSDEESPRKFYLQ